jgi:hypothetical protein
MVAFCDLLRPLVSRSRKHARNNHPAICRTTLYSHSKQFEDLAQTGMGAGQVRSMEAKTTARGGSGKEGMKSENMTIRELVPEDK